MWMFCQSYTVSFSAFVRSEAISDRRTGFYQQYRVNNDSSVVLRIGQVYFQEHEKGTTVRFPQQSFTNCEFT